MIEQGKVIKVYQNNAEVKIQKKDECSKCGLCLFKEGADSTIVSAENPLNAKVGDVVTISTQKDNRLLGAILVFLIPLLLIGVAVAINALWINVEIWIPILSVIFVVLWYTILAVIDKKLKNKKGFCPVIVSIDNAEKNDKNEDNGDNERAGV